DAMGLEDGAALMNLLEARAAPTVVACGHVHQAITGWGGGVRWLTTPSTCSQARPFADRFVDDDLGPGFRWFELRDDGRWESGVERLPAPAPRLA
ncbi:MAG: phosphodiesterase, partial [Pseudomonadota bacterium]